MNSVITALLHRQGKALKIRQPLECFEVTDGELHEIMLSGLYFIDTGPKPPLKARATWHGGGGLFSSGISGSYEEWDYHAPEYLEARKNWKPSEPKLFGLPLKVI